MKLRILGDSIRIRLSQSELRELAMSGRFEETVHFAADLQLKYVTVKRYQATPLSATFVGHTIEVGIAPEELERLATTEVVGLSHVQSIEGGRKLKLLVEKDFQCITPPEGEDQTDAFPNPKASC